MKFIITETQRDRIAVLRRYQQLKDLIRHQFPYYYPCDYDSLEMYMVAMKTEMFGTLTLDWFEDIDNDVIWDVVTDLYGDDIVNNYISKCKDNLIKEENEGQTILYHGGHNLEGKNIKFPMFLTPVKRIAEWYGYERGDWINEFYLDIDKPLDSVDDWKLVLEDIGIDWDDFDGDMVWQLNKKDSNRGNWNRTWGELGGDILDIIYYKPFRESMKKFGYDVIIWEDAGNQDTTGLVYIPLYKNKLHYIKSYKAGD